MTSYIPTVSLLPYCDGDVISSEGQNYTDLGRDLAADDTALRSSLMVMGANHNFFNTEWTPATATAPETAFDDWGGDPDATCGKRTAERLTATEQRSVGRGYIAGAVWLLADHDMRVLPFSTAAGSVSPRPETPMCAATPSRVGGSSVFQVVVSPSAPSTAQRRDSATAMPVQDSS